MTAKFIIVTLLAFAVHGESNAFNPSEAFTLSGLLKGNDTKLVVLTYNDAFENLVHDTIAVEDGRFQTSGSVRGAVMGSLSGVFDVNEGEDSFYFFLEPGQMSIEIDGGNLNEAVVKGSVTQEKHEELENEIKKMSEELAPLVSRRNDLVKANENHANDRLIDSLSLIQEQSLNKIKDRRLRFVQENNDSYLSAYWLGFYFGKIPEDSVSAYYENLTPRVKQSSYASEIRDKVAILKKAIPSNIGDKAYSFNLKDTLDNQRSLAEFKGKYVLLDFWASWCGPCREANPRLRQLYDAYRAQGLEIVGISGDADKESWLQAIDQDKINIWHHLFSGDDIFFNTVNFNFKAIPAYILVDKQGYIVGRYLNASTENKDFEDLENKLSEIFSHPL